MNRVLIMCTLFIPLIAHADDTPSDLELTQSVNSDSARTIDDAIFQANAKETRKFLQQGKLPSEHARRCVATYACTMEESQRGEWWHLYHWMHGLKEDKKPAWYQLIVSFFAD